MNLKHNDIWLGAGVVTFGVFLLAYAIPVFVSSPSNVRVVFLSPTFWPTIIGWLIIVLGATLILTRMFGVAMGSPETPEADKESRDEFVFAMVRLAAIAVIMIGLILAIPVLGMVLATGIAFALISFIVRTRRPLISLTVAIILPLVLYGFFAHVAGVSLPQGRFLTLP